MIGVRRRALQQKAEQGVVAVEFVIIAPILLLILFAIVEFGIALSKYEVYIQAAR